LDIGFANPEREQLKAHLTQDFLSAFVGELPQLAIPESLDSQSLNLLTF
jgi:hypothetical protein